jgi:four helix bundle protein
MKSFKDLDAWIKSSMLVKKVYQLTNKIPQEEKFGLISQMRRCSISVPANIAERMGRNTRKDTIQFLHISRGSLYELETYFFLCQDLDYISEEDCNLINKDINTCGMLLNGLIKYMERMS